MILFNEDSAMMISHTTSTKNNQLSWVIDRTSATINSRNIITINYSTFTLWLMVPSSRISCLFEPFQWSQVLPTIPGAWGLACTWSLCPHHVAEWNTATVPLRSFVWWVGWAIYVLHWESLRVVFSRKCPFPSLLIIADHCCACAAPPSQKAYHTVDRGRYCIPSIPTDVCGWYTPVMTCTCTIQFVQTIYAYISNHMHILGYVHVYPVQQFFLEEATG